MELFNIIEVGTQAVTFLMLMSGIPPCIEMYKTKDTNKMNYIFILLGLTNAFAGVIYGRLLSNQALININVVAILFQVVFVLVYILVSRSKSKPLTQGFIAAATLLCFHQYLLHVVIKEDAVVNQLGMFMFIIANITWASPFLEVQACIQKQSAEDVSLSVLIGGTACCVMWLLYGLMLKDFYIYSPNIIGLSTSAAKMLMIVIYGSKPIKRD